jgi:hypothetical protein
MFQSHILAIDPGFLNLGFMYCWVQESETKFTVHVDRQRFAAHTLCSWVGTSRDWWINRVRNFFWGVFPRDELREAGNLVLIEEQYLTPKQWRVGAALTTLEAIIRTVLAERYRADVVGMNPRTVKSRLGLLTGEGNAKNKKNILEWANEHLPAVPNNHCADCMGMVSAYLVGLMKERPGKKVKPIEFVVCGPEEWEALSKF